MKTWMVELFVFLGGVSFIFKELLSEEPVLIHAAFAWALRFPAAKSFVVTYASTLKEIMDAADKAVDSEIDQAGK